ncbi:FeoB-associated Cys-rich membrane protein [Ruminococcus flavefaciens]|uniref:FeoB-associated Cys-rich membrane protein n=1 Tax=Ruminococcus flavefaciens TaxID=1265 RepID=UPI0026F04ACE|nr:FeoB-associated Cys-rich membrane protein [Ruminococcus flavefaciens]
MLAWLSENLGTIIVSLILIAVVSTVIVKMVKDKKQGKSSCGCGCENCAMHGKCHK